MSVKWEDVTSWSRRDDEKARKTPLTWQADVGPLRLVVTRHMHLAPTDWLIRCDGLNINSDIGGNVSAAAAQAKLVALVERQLRDALKVLSP
jgi:hypothetical protein